MIRTLMELRLSGCEPAYQSPATAPASHSLPPAPPPISNQESKVEKRKLVGKVIHICMFIVSIVGCKMVSLLVVQRGFTDTHEPLKTTKENTKGRCKKKIADISGGWGQVTINYLI